MAVLKQKKGALKGSVMVDVFAGIDKSTGRHRITGQGEIMYEVTNTFPYIQGRMQRRRDVVSYNTRASDAAFPTFPAQTMVGNPIIKKVMEFNDNIVIFYVDDNAPTVLLCDRIDIGANTITAVITSATGKTVISGGDVDAVVFTQGTQSSPMVMVSPQGAKLFKLHDTWTTSTTIANNNTDGLSEVFLQAHFFKRHGSNNAFTRGDVGSVSAWEKKNYTIREDVGSVIRMMTFGYQTSSTGAYTNLLFFKPTSIWLLTSISTDASFEQVSGNIGLAGRHAVALTPHGVAFVGRDKDGLLNFYLLGRRSLTLHTIGHELYEVLNNIPKENYNDIVVSYFRNRMVRIVLTQNGDFNDANTAAEVNNQEYWIDFYNADKGTQAQLGGLGKRTYWGPFPHSDGDRIVQALEFSGGNTPDNAGYFLIKKNSNTYSLAEEIDTDLYDSSNSVYDDQINRTKFFDFGIADGIVSKINITALGNGAKFKVFFEQKIGILADIAGVISSTGGLIPAGKFYVVVAEKDATGQILAATRLIEADVPSGSTNQITFTTPSVATSVYDVYIGAEANHLKCYRHSLDVLPSTSTNILSVPTFGPVAPKAGEDDQTFDTPAGPGDSGTAGEYQMGTTGVYETKPIRLIPSERLRLFGLRAESNSDSSNPMPFELNQIGFDFVRTMREVVE